MFANSNKKRSLILAGGGLKVAFQAGVLQVWLDEVGLEFDHADGASGGTFNLAMYCQGMSGTQMADNWRNIPIRNGIEFNWRQYQKLIYARSILTMDKWRENIFSSWGLDWEVIRASSKEATFNVYNFTKHQLEILPPNQMNEDLLVACGSLPMWFPPVEIKGNLYIDAVYLTDANLMAAIRRGADELWIIWTVSDRPVWHDGFVANYFQIIETTANGHFRQDLRRIEANNTAIAAGQSGEFGRHIDLKILKGEVPLHYLINLSSDRFKESVNRGVEFAREWCQERGITATKSGGSIPTEPMTKLRFTEEMKGYITLGESDYRAGFKSEDNGSYLMVELTIKMDDVEKFITEPQHDASVEGEINCEILGGKLPIEKGRFNLFIDEGDPTHKKMLYRLYFKDIAGHPLTLDGFKDVKDDPGFDLWSDTSTLYTRIYRGQIEPGGEQFAEIVAAGIIQIHLVDFLKQLTTFRAEGPTAASRVSALTRFGIFFLGKLWDVYANQVLLYGPY
ncbi:MAG: patatin-like phospholipase family protein [Cyanosarcina radialis HA8281-LM2]|jgi:predicted acylesterase/phospholipase RssA|nr:patatin-like phospholipase family protein [Cyanosarcina radialis HA8281-LM2]